jgi:hypothetical protein
MLHGRKYLILRVGASLLLLGSSGLAQSTFGSITGIVTDPSGSLVPDAKVSITNTATGAVRDTTTGTTGVFNAPNLDLGTYRIRVTAKGFTTYERIGLQLAANQVLNVNVEMAVGPTASVVEVAAASPTITTETSDLSGSMGGQAVQELPLVTRHYGDQGINTYYAFNTGASTVPTSSYVYLQGTRYSGSAPTRDGITIMSYMQGTGPVQPSLESVQELTFEKSVAPAEFASPGSRGAVTKAGTNQFHGAAFWDYNGNKLNARSFFSSTVPFRVYNDFGASAGGPIWKNKLFFFAAYEGSREAANTVLIEDVPLPAWRSGDFSSLVSQNILIKNPFTGQPFQNNQIPANLISPVSQAMQAYFFPSPNTGTPGAQSSNWQGQYRGTTGFTRFNHLDARVDYNISSHDIIFGRFSWRRLPLDYTDIYPLHVGQLRHGQSAVFSWNHTFTPSTINEFRFGATYHRNFYEADAVGSDLLHRFGIQGITTAGIHNVPILTVTGVTAIDLDGTSDSYQDNPAIGLEWIDNLSWTRGKHFLKFGFDAIRDRYIGNNISSNVYGSYSFSGIYTGIGYADFLLGIPQTTTVGLPNPNRDIRGATFGLYAQDQFKVSRSLTLNYGIRLELERPYLSAVGAIYSFNPQTGALIVPDNGSSRLNPFYPKNIPVVIASQAGYPTQSLVAFNKTGLANLEPRFGFAYKPFKSDRTVIRGGYGIYGNLIYGELARSQMTGGPFSGTVTYTNSIANGTPLFSFPSPFLSSGATSVQNVNGVNPNLKTPYTEQWNLTVEHQISSIGLRISYVGTRSIDLVYRRNLNQPPPSLTPFTTALRRYPVYNQIIYADTGGTEFYNSLELAAQKKFSQNLMFNTGWTWAKDLTDTQDTGGGGSTYGGQVIQNQFCRACEKANSQVALPRRLFAYALYNLPFGSSQHFLSGAKGPLDQIIGGWETVWAVVVQSGQWFTPSFSGFDPSNTNTIGGRPDVVPGVSSYPANQGVNNWFNASAFAIPGCPASTPVCTSPANLGRFGNAGLNILAGPPVRNLDFALLKYFSLTEKTRLQFRLNMSNALNHPNFATPRANISSRGTVATINSQVRSLVGAPAPREIDFGLRLEF